MIERIYTVNILCPACNSTLDMTEDRKCRNCGHDYGPPPPTPKPIIVLEDIDQCNAITPGDGAALEGWFTAEQLRRIADAIDGNATQQSAEPESCPRCHGKGTEVLVDYTNDRQPITHVGTCTLCHGLKWQQP